jgi:hypothetical protein
MASPAAPSIGLKRAGSIGRLLRTRLQLRRADTDKIEFWLLEGQCLAVAMLPGAIVSGAESANGNFIGHSNWCSLTPLGWQLV